jgi:hypothetical protein
MYYSISSSLPTVIVDGLDAADKFARERADYLDEPVWYSPCTESGKLLLPDGVTPVPLYHRIEAVEVGPSYRRYDHQLAF